jgi:hypothetical protein
LAAVVGLDETKAFLAVEPLHDTSRHISIPSGVLSIHAPTIGGEIKFSERVEGGSGARSQNRGWRAGEPKRYSMAPYPIVLRERQGNSLCFRR